MSKNALLRTSAYSEILEGTYVEELPCALLRVPKEGVEDALQRTKGAQLAVARIPRVVSRRHLIGPGERISASQAFALQAGEASLREDDVFLLLKDSASAPGVGAGAPVGGRLFLGYKYFTHTELLKKAIPDLDEFQSSYNKVGSIIHLNLKESALPHKDIISKVLLDKVKDARTVIRKASSISSAFRSFEIEHLQGERQYRARQRENGLVFAVDYDKVYWNSKLQRERWRLAEGMSEGEAVCDMFCGVGPFSILAATKGATVYANDLNPASISNLGENLRINRAKMRGADGRGVEGRMFVYNMDAEEFLARATRDYNARACRGAAEGLSRPFDHYILNLPSRTLSFLLHFHAVYDKCRAYIEQNKGSFLVHAYFFTRGQADPVREVEDAVQRRLPAAQKRLVRKVSPSKEMWLVTFSLRDLSAPEPLALDASVEY